MKRKLWFVLDVRFPTEKAYGVTTTYTALAVKEMKDYDVEIITPKLDKSLDNLIATREIPMPFSHLYQTLLSKGGKVAKVGFHAWKFLYAIKLSKSLNRNESILWLRDIQLTFFLNMSGFKTICEIHRTPPKMLRLQLVSLNRKNSSVLICITEHLKKKLKLSGRNVIVAGMSVNENELKREVRKKSQAAFTVGYLGTSHSSGNVLSLTSVLRAAAECKSQGLDTRFKLIGISSDEAKHIFKQSIPDNLEFLGRVNRKAALNLLDTFDVGLVLYPNSKYFIDSFPIKIVEYAARRVPILASDTHAHRMILGKDKALFFNLDSERSLLDSILELKSSLILCDSLSKNAFTWVESHTYQRRAHLVLTFSQTRFGE